MARAQRLSTLAVVTICLMGTQWTGALLASESAASGAAASPTVTASASQVYISPGLAPVTFLDQQSNERIAVSSDGDSPSGPLALRLDTALLTATPLRTALAPGVARAFDAEFSTSARQVYQGRPYPYRGRHDASVAALMIGAAATITGAALLVYANRPDCSTDPTSGGCGYGYKVIGTSVLSAGIVGLFVGALTW